MKGLIKLIILITICVALMIIALSIMYNQKIWPFRDNGEVMMHESGDGSEADEEGHSEGEAEE